MSSVNDLAERFAGYIEQQHQLHNYIISSSILAEAMGILFRYENFYAVSANTPRFVVVSRDDPPSRRNFSGMHGLGRIMLRRSGIEAEIVGLIANPEEVEDCIKKFCNNAACLLLMPQHLVAQAQVLYGESPHAILHLTRENQVSVDAALRRHVHADPLVWRAAFVMKENCIKDLDCTSLPAPFRRNEQMTQEQLLIKFPDADLLPISRNRVLGTISRPLP